MRFVVWNNTISNNYFKEINSVHSLKNKRFGCYLKKKEINSANKFPQQQFN